VQTEPQAVGHEAVRAEPVGVQMVLQPEFCLSDE
jgi:hypothetical protein